MKGMYLCFECFPDNGSLGLLSFVISDGNLESLDLGLQPRQFGADGDINRRVASIYFTTITHNNGLAPE